VDIREKFISGETVYEGKYIRVEKRLYELCNGNEAQRDIVVHPEACAVVAVGDSGDVFLVEQYRAAFEKVLLEIPAGKLDPGETPGECVKRELLEETGLQAEKFTHLSSIAVSPGFCTEVIHIYLAEGLIEGEPDPDEDEHLHVSVMNIKKARQAALSGGFADGKTVVGLLLACEHLDL
jgi:ADP-ribose pyrophosphatase